LVKNNEISSTEKLLDVIRGDNKNDSITHDQQTFPSDQNSPIEDKKKALNISSVTIGIVPGFKEIILVKSETKKTGQRILLDYKKYPVPEGVYKDSSTYAKILNTAVTSFCSFDKRYELWCVIPTIDVETKLLVVPKVSQKKMYNAVYWSYKNEVNFNEADFLFDFDILGLVKDGAVEKKEVLAFTAPKREIDVITDLFSRAGLILYGVSIIAFAIQNLLRTQYLNPGCETVCTLFVGNDWSRIDVFTGKSLYLSRDIKTGYQSFIDCLVDIMSDPDQDRTKHNHSADQFFNQKLVNSHIHNYEENTHFTKIEPVTDRLVKQIERTFEYYQTKSGKNPINKLYLTGRLCNFSGLIDYLSKKLGISVEIINPFKQSDFKGDAELSDNSVSDVYLPAFGMSLSHNTYTPNLIYTSKDKEIVQVLKAKDRFFLMIIFLIVLVLSGFSFWQKMDISFKQTKVNQIQSDINLTSPPVTKAMIQDKSFEIKSYHSRIKETSRKFLTISAISEICRLTPDTISLMEILIKNVSVDDNHIKVLSLNGYIFDDRLLLDASLAGYREELNSSRLFQNIAVLNKTMKYVNQKDALLFEIQLEIPQGL